MRKTKVLFFFLAFVLVFAFCLIDVSDSTAMPNFSRKYGMDCASCHAPAVPRLNAEGHRFRKMGFRFAHEIGKKPDYKEIGEYVAMRGRARYRYQDPETGDSISRFEWHDATLFYAGAVTENLSGFFEWEWEDVDDIALVAQMSWFQGSADRYWTLRLGQFHVLQRVGWAGFDRPTGITTSDVLGSRSLTDSTVPFRLSQDQRGLEFTYGFNQDARFIATITNGLNFNGSGNSGSFDDDLDKDFLLAYEQMIGDKGSGFTLFAYRGVYHQRPRSVVGVDATGADIVIGDRDKFNEFEYWRLGATAAYANQWFDFGLTELIGGYVYSLDELPKDYPVRVAGEDKKVEGNAFFVEVDQYLPHDAAVFFRADFIEPDRDLDFRQRYTWGSVYTVASNLRLAGEVFYLNEENKKNADAYGVLAEAMINF